MVRRTTFNLITKFNLRIMNKAGLTSLFALFLFLSISYDGYTQSKQLTLEDAVGLNREIYPKRINQLMWMGNSDKFSYVEENQLYSSSPGQTEGRVMVTLDDLNAGLTDMGEDSIKRFPRIKYLDENIFRFTHKNDLYVYNIITRNIEHKNTYPIEAKNVNINDNTFSIAYTIDNNLYVNMDSKKYPISWDDDLQIVNGQTVHRVEFGINTGIFWSPEGNYLAFYRKDESMVTDYPLVDIEPRIAEIENTKYPMAGMTSEEVTLGVYDMNTRKTVFMNTGTPVDQYLTSVSWDPTEQSIYIGVLNRDQNHLKLNKYDVSTGDYIQTLFEEKHDKYVEPEHPMYFLDSKPDRFIWFSERDGWQHLYLYNTSGELIKQITQGEWVVNSFLGTDPKGKTAYFTATKEGPLQKHIYSVGIKSGKMIKLSPDHGSHRGTKSYSGNYFFDIYSSTDMASEYRVVNNKGQIIRVLESTQDPLKDYNLGETSIVTIKAEDGTDLYGRIIKPSNFEAGKKYPVFFYVYGGPHSQLVNDSWLASAGIFQNYMAQQGYVVFTMDNRGTANRGLEFEQAIFRNLGDLEVSDQMKGVEYLKSLDFVDPDRIGIDGWSYGGFMTISMMLQNPGVFKVACAGGPVIDWKYYEIMYGERYMDTPETNPDGYENASLLNRVDQLEGKLMIIHGTKDPTVVWQNSLAFLKACVDEGKQVDYFVYPGHGHNVRGKDRMHLYEKLKGYFDDALK